NGTVSYREIGLHRLFHLEWNRRRTRHGPVALAQLGLHPAGKVERGRHVSCDHVRRKGCGLGGADERNQGVRTNPVGLFPLTHGLLYFAMECEGIGSLRSIDVWHSIRLRHTLPLALDTQRLVD